MEQLAQFVTKSFEFNNCFSAKLMEAKQKLPSLATGGGDAFLNFGLNGGSSSASNTSSNGSGNNSLMDLGDSGASNGEEDDSQSKDNVCKGAQSVDKRGVVECGGAVKSKVKEDEDEDEIDIETDSMSDMEDNKRLITTSPKTGPIVDGPRERLRVIKPADLRIHKTTTATEKSQGLKQDVPSDKNLDSNNNTTVIKPPLIATKNWLIPDSPSSSESNFLSVQELSLLSNGI